VPADEYAAAEPDPLAEAADDILAHVNDGHAGAGLAYAPAAAGASDATASTTTAVDRYGLDLAVATPRGPARGAPAVRRAGRHE
jgi:hypothetical protein